MNYRYFIFFGLFYFHSIPVFAQLLVSGYFGDQMVIQRNQPITIWGTEKPGVKVTVELGTLKGEVKSDGNGNWRVTLGALPASGPLELKVADGDESETFREIMIGDVWLISGQSNVVLPLMATIEWPKIKKKNTFNNIRFCKIPNSFSLEPVAMFSNPVSWVKGDPAKVGMLSGVGYYFARTVQPAIGVTLGIVQGSSGGTQIEQWMPSKALKAVDPNNPNFVAHDKTMMAMKAESHANANTLDNAGDKEEGQTDPDTNSTTHNKLVKTKKVNSNPKVNAMTAGTASLFNDTIYPLQYAKITGVVWYQGESNTLAQVDYGLLLKTLIQSWRGVFEEPELPFVVVQLPGFGLVKDDGWMRMREAQRLTVAEMGQSLVVTIDLGSSTTIHPPNKREVGRRCGLAALEHIYHQTVEGTSPFPKIIQFSGDTVKVGFDGFKGDLLTRGKSPQGFEVSGSDGKFIVASAKVEGRYVFVHAEGVPHPQKIRYLWASFPETIDLYSVAGLPVVPFQSNVSECE